MTWFFWKIQPMFPAKTHEKINFPVLLSCLLFPLNFIWLLDFFVFLYYIILMKKDKSIRCSSKEGLCSRFSWQIHTKFQQEEDILMFFLSWTKCMKVQQYEPLRKSQSGPLMPISRRPKIIFGFWMAC